MEGHDADTGSWGLLQQDEVNNHVAKYLDSMPSGLSFAVGSITAGTPSGRILYYQNQGYNQLGASIDVGEDVAFEIASITKTMTATLTVILLGAQLSSQFSDYQQALGLSNDSSSLNPVTLQNFLSYGSGLPADNVAIDGQNFCAPFTAPPPTGFCVDALLSYLQYCSPELGTTGSYAYSNLGFAILAQILGPASGLGVTSPAFRSAMQQQVFDVLQMNCKFNGNSTMHDVISGYSYDQSSGTWTGLGAGSPYPSPGWPWFPAFEGAGGVLASPHDLLIWLRYNMGLAGSSIDNVLSALQTQYVEAWTDASGVPTYTCLGWFKTLGAQNDGLTVYWKDGALNTFQSYITFANPTNGISPGGVFVLVNGSGMYVDDGNGDEIPLASVLANDFIYLMSGNAAPDDKSRYPSAHRRRRKSV